MARKKTSKSLAPPATASRFKDVDGTQDPRLRKAESVAVEKEKEPEAQVEATNAFGDDPYSQPFPFNHIYATQDFLNEHLDYRKSIQLLIITFLLQLLYNYDRELVMEYIERIGMNYIGVSIGLVFTYNLTWKKHLQGTSDKPVLPEFNLLYAVLLPNLLALKFRFNIIEILCYNYFVVENLPILVRALSSITFYFLYGDADQAEFIKKVLVFIFLNYALQYINEGNEEHVISKEVQKQDVDYELVEVKNNQVKSGLNASLSKSEIQLLLVAIVNLVFNLKTEDLNLVIFQKLVVSFIGGLLFSYPVFKASKLASVPVFAGLFYYLANYQLQAVLGKNSIFWVLDLIQQDPNLKYFIAWGSILLINILIIFNANIEFNLRRKLWHFIILGTIVPGLVYNKSFTVLALLGLIIVLALVEVVRSNKITVVGEILYDKLYKFQDFKDLKGPLNVSYIYLVIGITTPVVLYDLGYGSDLNIKQFLGLITLGVSDAVASIVGKSIGKRKIFDSNKTVEGSFAFFVSMIVSCFAINTYLDLGDLNWEVVVVGCTVAAFFEGVASLNDNLYLPVFTYVLWEVLELTSQQE